MGVRSDNTNRKGSRSQSQNRLINGHNQKWFNSLLNAGRVGPNQPSGIDITIKMWGAGGGNKQPGAPEAGGSGGYVELSQSSYTEGETWYLYVGGGGQGDTEDGGFGGGGDAGSGGTWAAGAGGASYIFRNNAQPGATPGTDLIAVAGGGGGNAWSGGGNGGTSAAQDGGDHGGSYGGEGGTDSTFGEGGGGSAQGGTGVDGELLHGGTGGANGPGGGDGGGGGGGYYGGGGGGGAQSGASGSGGGGGSSYVNTGLGWTEDANQKNPTIGAANNTSDPYYNASSGGAGGPTSANQDGTPGQIVVIIDGTATTYTYTGAVQPITVSK